MSAPVVWFGPVSQAQVRPSVPAGRELHVVNCVGAPEPGKPFGTCRGIADGWRAADGRRVPLMRSRLGLAEGSDVFLAALSAGGQCVRRLLLDGCDRAEVAGAALFDATYGEWEDFDAVRIDQHQRALVDFATEAMRDGRPFVATASTSPAGKAPTASRVLRALRARIASAAGHSDPQSQATDALGDPLLEGLRDPVWAWRCRNVLLVDFGAAYSHGDHALAVAPVLLPRALALGP